MRARQKGGITAGELLARLEADPAYQERMLKREIEHARRLEEYRAAEKPVVDSLKTIGVDVGSITELVENYTPLRPRVVEILVKQLPTISNEWVKEAVVRALAAARQPFDGECLVQVFSEPRNESLRWAIANTIAEARPTGVTQWLLRAVRQRAYGKAREMLMLALARLTPAEAAIPVLLSLFREFPGHVAMALAEVGGQGQLPFLHQAYKNARGWIKKEIAKAITRIEARSQ